MTIKRLNYFTGQFLEAADFKAEQDYHIDMRRRGNKALYYSAGILDGGFVVTQAPGDPTKIIISPGIGIDTQGRELVITEAMTVSLPLPTTTQEVFVVTLRYKPEPTDFKTVVDTVTTDGVTTTISLNEATRLKEEADVEVRETVPADALVIAKITIDTTGKLIGSIVASMRPLANVRFPGDVIVGQGGFGVLKTRHIDGKNCVQGPTVDDNDHLYLNWNTGKDVYLGFGAGTKSSLYVSGNVGIGTTQQPQAKLEVVGGGGGSIDLIVNGRLQSNNNDGGLWVASDRFVGGHSTDKIGFWNGGAWQLTVQKDGRVGIGTTDIKRTLQVQGNGIHSGGGGAGYSFSNRQSEFVETPASGERWVWYADGGTARLWSGTDKLSVTKDGYVGFGTADPKARLDIEGTALLGYETSITLLGIGDFGAPLKSGFYQNNGGKIAGDVPDLSSGWTHLITARHNNPANNHQLQIAASYVDNDRLYFRKIAAAGISNPAWKEVATRDTNVFTGDQTIQKTLKVGSNSIHFTSGWSGFPGTGTSVAEISNDTSVYKSLMIAGNRSANPNVRLVSVWDRLEVNGVLNTTGEIQTTSPNAFRMVSSTYGSFFRNDGSDTYLLLTNSGDPYGGWNGLRPLRIKNATGEVFITSLDVGSLNVTGGGGYVTVKGLGNEQAYIGGDGYGNDVQVGSFNSTVDKVVFYNATNKGYMDIFYRNSSSQSDRRSKKNITRLTGALDCIMKLRGVFFDWKAETSKENGKKNIGFIAQEVEKVLPEVVSQSSRGTYGVNYTAVIPVLVEAIKEQQKEIEKLKQARTKGA